MRIQKCLSSHERENLSAGSPSTFEVPVLPGKNPSRRLDPSSGVSPCRYAWLERDGAEWHFLTSLAADPRESTRRWPDSQPALAELEAEGWSIVRPYTLGFRAPGFVERVDGYGLTRRVH